MSKDYNGLSNADFVVTNYINYYDSNARKHTSYNYDDVKLCHICNKDITLDKEKRNGSKIFAFSVLGHVREHHPELSDWWHDDNTTGMSDYDKQLDVVLRREFRLRVFDYIERQFSRLSFFNQTMMDTNKAVEQYRLSLDRVKLRDIDYLQNKKICNKL